jgi:hypothetical protein
MSVKFATRVDRARKGGGSALMFFNLNIGITNEGGEFQGLLTATDFVLMKSKKGDFFFKGPSKQRIKNGEVQMKDGYPIYDEQVKLYGEDGAGEGGKWGVTKLAFALRNKIIEQAAKAYEELGGSEQTNASRGGEKKAAATTTTGASKGGDPFGGDSEEELPF